MNPFFQKSPAHQFIKSPAWQRNIHEEIAMDAVSESIFGFFSNFDDLYDFISMADFASIPESTTPRSTSDFYGNVVSSPFNFPVLRRYKKIYYPYDDPDTFITQTAPPDPLADENYEGPRFFFNSLGAPVNIFPTPSGTPETYNAWVHSLLNSHHVGMASAFYIVMGNPNSRWPGPVDGSFTVTAAPTLHMGRRSRFKFSFSVVGFMVSCEFSWPDPTTDSPTIGNLSLIEEFSLAPFAWKELPNMFPIDGDRPGDNTGYFVVLGETPATFTSRTGLAIL